MTDETSPEDSAQLGGPRAPAGWYQDPAGGPSQSYWDGTKWTGETRRPAPPAPARGTPSNKLPRNLVIGGGLALAASPFLTWVKVVLLGDLTLFQLYDAAGRSNAWAWIAVIAGVVAAIVAWTSRKEESVRMIGLLVGVIGGVIAAYALVGLRHDIRQAAGFAAIGVGPYVAIGGCVAMAVGGLMSKRSGRMSRPGS